MSDNTITKVETPAQDVVDGAVGVEKTHWFVAIVNPKSEKVVAGRLDKLGIRNYLATQSEIRVWKNGRKTKVDRMVIPSTIFIRCTEKCRREIVKMPFISRFMTNKASGVNGSLNKPVATIPDRQIETLKFMLCQSDTPVNISSADFKAGDKVRVLRGSLVGLEGEVTDMSKDKSELIVRLDVFGCAKLIIDTVNLELIR